MAINCASIPSNLLESELFGYEEALLREQKRRESRSFRAGKRRIAFLDEVGELPLEIQARLLRVLQGREIMT